MSYSLQVWGRQSANIDDVLTSSKGWVRDEHGWTLEKSSWQISISVVQKAEPEDVPPEAAEALPGLSVLMNLNLESIFAPKTAYSELRNTARSLAAVLAGIVEDPQDGSFTLPRGAKRYAKPTREERFDLLELSWWYMDSPLRRQGGSAELIRILADTLPEAVPRRYGLYEPPQYKTDETGQAALAAFITETLDEIGGVFYTTRPVIGFYISDSNLKPLPRFGFKSRRFCLELELDALQQPGWEVAVRHLWRNVSRFFQPFYGEARVLRQYKWSGRDYQSDRRTDVHPVYSWWWRGLPPTPGLGLVLGPPYSLLWQVDGAEQDGELAFAEHPDWSLGERMDLRVPPELAQRWEPTWVKDEHGGYSINWCKEYPPEWPFEQETPVYVLRVPPVAGAISQVNWDGYELYDLGVTGPRRELDRHEARAAYEKLMREKDDRIAMLKRLLLANGVELDGTDESVQKLEDWYAGAVELDPEIPPTQVIPGISVSKLKAEYYSLAIDIGIYLGELVITRTGTLKWEFFTGGKSHVGYQRAVISGFTNVTDPKYYRVVDRFVAGYGHAVFKGTAQVGEFLKYVRETEKLA